MTHEHDSTKTLLTRNDKQVIEDIYSQYKGYLSFHKMKAKCLPMFTLSFLKLAVNSVKFWRVAGKGPKIVMVKEYEVFESFIREKFDADVHEIKYF